MNIIIIGMRGSGKTTVGQLLAQRLGLEFIEMDKELEKLVGMSIAKFVKQHGWNSFRDKESELVKTLAIKNRCVISTGGGVITREENVKILKSIGTIVWLNASIDSLIERVGKDPDRPSLTGKPMKEDLKITLKQREKMYKQAADHIINTSKKRPEEVVFAIINNSKGSYD